MSSLFFDANVLLDILLPGRANHAKAVEAYIRACDRFDRLATSENIVTTIEYIAAKNGTPCETTARFFEVLEENFTLYGFGEILSEGFADYKTACKAGEKMDFEDMLQLKCAAFNGCSAFLTEDSGIHRLENTALTVYRLDEI